MFYLKRISEGLVQAINGKRSDISIHNLIQDLNCWSERLPSSQFRFVKRQVNQAAHLLARTGPQNNIFQNCKFHPLGWLINTLYSDILLSF